MKKILEKIVSVSLTVVGLLFIALLFVIMFGAVSVDELNNQLVKVLVISLSAVFSVLAIIMIFSSFTDHDKLNSILLFKDKESATKASVSVVKKLVKNASKRVEAAKVTKVVLIGDENNNVKLVVYIKVKSNETETVINRVRAEIMATCDKVLEYQFSTVDFKITQVKADYKPTDSEIDAKVAAFQREKEAARLKAAAEKAVQETEAPVIDAATPDEIAATTDEIAPVESEGIENEDAAESAEASEAEQDAEALAAPDTEDLTNTTSSTTDADEATPQADALEEDITEAEAESNIAEDQEVSETEEEKQ
ncbi:MAG: hypothetical protein PHI19_01015 [Clostridia bacterium]|nr:hypothetical protein [Clostridia bacterium]